LKVVVGVDIGGSATKIVGFKGGSLSLEPMLIHASDPITSLFGAFGKFITLNNLKLADVESIMITGLGASFVTEPIYGIQTARVDEFLAIGLGGLYLSELSEALVVSMGTGTAFVSAKDGEVRHLGGSGVGGGTLTGLASKLVNAHDMDFLLKLAEKGDLSEVDLRIKDITTKKMFLDEDVTVSNFGKMNDSASNEDIALGLMNMAFQTIGVMSYFLTKVTDDKNVVLTGKLSTFCSMKKLMDAIGDLYKINFIIRSSLRRQGRRLRCLKVRQAVG
jgi:type II pantothenate kinase